MFELTKDAIEANGQLQDFADPAAGALCVFDGRVRNHHDGKAVDSLEYEAFGELAEREGKRIVSEAADRFDVLSCRAVHRVGALAIGDISVWVGVLAEHRGDAFTACRFIIDEIKHRLPIWKREHYGDGSVAWVNCSHDHGAENVSAEEIHGTSGR